MSVMIIIAFIFGAIIGSFLNVVSIRLNTGVGIDGRSKCMSCNKTLVWYELIPILSFVFQIGRCRNCRSRLSPQYPLVEFGTGMIFAFIVWKYLPLDFLTSDLVATGLYLLATCFLMVIAVYDIKHKIIPDLFVYTFGVIGLVSVFLGGYGGLIHGAHIWTLLAGPILALPFALIWVVSRGRWIGLGDAKLALGIGWFLGMNGGINAVVLAFWIGSIVSIVWMFSTQKKFKPRLEVPLGPYLILGFYLVLIFGLNVLDLRVLQTLF